MYLFMGVSELSECVPDYSYYFTDTQKKKVM